MAMLQPAEVDIDAADNAAEASATHAVVPAFAVVGNALQAAASRAALVAAMDKLSLQERCTLCAEISAASPSFVLRGEVRWGAGAGALVKSPPGFGANALRSKIATWRGRGQLNHGTQVSAHKTDQGTRFAASGRTETTQA